jgi:hemerythrin-like domain-containing protein
MTTTNAPVPPFAVTTRRPGDPEVDLTGFRLIHRTMRSGTRLLADAVAGIARNQRCTRDRQRAVVTFARHVLHEIHCHHEREDDVLWPVIVASVDGRLDLTPLSDDHVELAKLLDRVEQALPGFARDPGAGAPLLAPALTELADLLDEHIAEEEQQVFPVIREHVSAADFERCEKQFRKGMAAGHLLFVLAWIADNCTPEERATLLAEGGPAIRLLLRLGSGRYARLREAVRG